MKDKLKNLLSRKFLVTILTNIMTYLIALGVDSDNAKIICYLLIAVVDIVYVAVEYGLDKASILKLTETLVEAAEDLVDTKEPEEVELIEEDTIEEKISSTTLSGDKGDKV